MGLLKAVTWVVILAVAREVATQTAKSYCQGGK